MKRRILEIQDFSSNIYYANNKEYFLHLIEIFKTHRNACSVIKNKSNKHLLQWIDNQLPKLADKVYKLSTKCYWIFNNFTDFPICSTCGKNTGFKNKNVKVHEGYHKFCCNRCTQKDEEVNEHKKAGCMKSLGVEHPLQSKLCMEKYHKTCLKKLGVDHNFKSDTCKEKRKKTWNKNFGYDNPMKSPVVKQRHAKNFKKKYGVNNPSQLESVKRKKQKTTFKNYGVNNPMQSDILKLANENTCYAKYGVRHYVQSIDFIQKAHKKYIYDEKNFASAPELAFYIWLKDNNKSFTYQPIVDLSYEFEGKMHKYFPDFVVDGQLIELKGDQFLKEDNTWQNPYDHSKDSFYEAKHQCAIANNVIILYHKDYQKYLDYVKEKYGATFLKQFKK